jgi:hypothetical protein
MDAMALPGKPFDVSFEMPEPEVGIMTFNRCVAAGQWEAMGRPGILEKNCHSTCPKSMIEITRMYNPNMKVDILAIPPRRDPGDVCCKWFGQTTAAEIAQSAGLTERTFLRHFTDKREVLFHGQHQFLQASADGADAAPPDASPLEVIASALGAAASLFPRERRPYSRMRPSVIDQNPALREREPHRTYSTSCAT